MGTEHELALFEELMKETAALAMAPELGREQHMAVLDLIERFISQSGAKRTQADRELLLETLEGNVMRVQNEFRNKYTFYL